MYRESYTNTHTHTHRHTYRRRDGEWDLSRLLNSTELASARDTSKLSAAVSSDLSRAAASAYIAVPLGVPAAVRTAGDGGVDSIGVDNDDSPSLSSVSPLIPRLLGAGVAGEEEEEVFG